MSAVVQGTGQLQTIAKILAIEDARAPAKADLDQLVRAMRLEPPVARVAVRAIGRLERPALVDVLIPQLAAADPIVRVEAATAIGQALAGSHPDKAALTARAIDALVAGLTRERDASVRGVICETLGRLPFHSVDRHRAIERVLVAETAAGIANVAGAVKGLEALIRLHQKSAPPDAATIDRLRQLVAEAPPASSPAAAPPAPPPARPSATQASPVVRQMVRHLAMQALVTARAVDAATIAAARTDTAALPGSPALRRLSLTALANLPGFERTDDLIAESARDASDEVRYEAIRVYGPRRAATQCRLLFDALDDRSPHVALLAIDLIDDRCPQDRARQYASRLVAALPDAGSALRIGPAKDAPVPRPAWNAGSRLRTPGTWHAPAHAIVTLARVAPEEARKALPGFSTHGVWQVRMYAARAASVLTDGDLLQTLATDAHDNVREAAIEALSRLRAHAADHVYLAALEREDYQLIRTAAGALEGTPLRERTAAAAVQALRRLTAQRRDTSRDPRVALLQRLREVGSAAQINDLRPYLADFDPRVATMAAEILTMWSRPPAGTPVPPAGTPAPQEYRPDPQPLLRPAPPTVEELDGLGRVRAVIRMRGGGVLGLRLLTGEAPLAVARFVRLARAGYYDGLTFHRIAPNFVIQGGSPGANEYMGDGPYMRDEVGLSNGRGLLGVSTRGRDTGDAQIYVNLIDNWRLDHDYTVFATVEQGTYTLYDIIEGDVIERVEILDRP